jgi:uncharacterized protein YndB with AHSA1/START domain
MGNINDLKMAVTVWRSLDVRQEINAPVEKVFEMLTAADGLNSWWTDASESDPSEKGFVK